MPASTGRSRFDELKQRMIPAQSVARKRRDQPLRHESSRGTPWPAGDWQDELRGAVTDVDELLHLTGIRSQPAAGAETGDGSALQADRWLSSEAVVGFPLRVPRPYIARMRYGDRADPLLRQVLPTSLEGRQVAGYGFDPLAEAAATAVPGLLRKYHGRALLIVAGTCAVNCRYCFRRHFPYAEHRQGAYAAALQAIRDDRSIREVILSGGDPLLLTDTHLGRLVEQIDAIAHVVRLRIHTRLPVVIPQRVTAALIELLATARPRVAIVLHFNHGNEIDADCVRALTALQRFTLLNQSVLLRGVNDEAPTLIELSERLFDAAVLPYYLHLPDAVAGTAHFDVCERRALAIHRRMTARLPGYLVPKLVREVPGGAAKEVVVGGG